MIPAPYNRAYALDLYCCGNRIAHDEVVYVSDDYAREEMMSQYIWQISILLP